jgi:Icc-related predicted phosphoesterase
MDWAFNLSRKGIKLREKWNMIPFGTDILITHSPPHGILDGVRPQPPGWGLESDPGSGPLGCEELAIRLNAVRPKLHVFGHIHDGYGYEERKGTIYVNASICDEKYRPVNQAVIVETDAKASSKRFRLVTQN